MYRRFIHSVFDQRIGVNRPADSLRRQFICGNRPDNPILVTGWNHISRDCARHRNGVFNRFMAVAVTKGYLIAGDAGRQNNPVGS